VGGFEETESMTEFRIECVRLGPITKHENADNLSITMVHGGYPCIIKTGQFAEGDLAVYVPVDALVPVAHQAFEFLKTGDREFERIKARRLRGVFSMGLLVTAPPTAKEGDDLQSHFGIQKWEPPAEKEPRGEFPVEEKLQRIYKPWPWWKRLLARWFPALFRKKVLSCPVYDIEGYRKHKGILVEGEEVSITEKIHGANFRAVYTKGKFHLGSRTTFGRTSDSDWGVVAERYDLARKMKRLPDLVLFGEVYGDVQDLKYGLPKGKVDLVAFDIMNIKTRKYLDRGLFLSTCSMLGVPVVPELYRGPWKPELVSLSEGKTTMPGANHVREGIVIKPVVERHDHHFGRVILKLAGEGYLTRKER
jgi:tRNA-binding EMAP/Myf-like protein